MSYFQMEGEIGFAPELLVPHQERGFYFSPLSYTMPDLQWGRQSPTQENKEEAYEYLRTSWCVLISLDLKSVAVPDSTMTISQSRARL